MSKTTEVLVAGVGGCGASALYHLVRRGVSAIGIDRFEPGHDRGSSHGDTRVIRQAYFEHPDYVPLLHRAYDLWHEIEEDAEVRLLELCGLLLLGPPDGEILAGARIASDRHAAPLEILDRAEVERRHPAFAIPEDFAAAWEPLGGYLRVEDCVRTYATRAQALGAELRTGESISHWSANDRGVRVETNREVYEAERLVLCPGAWAKDLLAGIAERARLRVLRKVLLWYPRRNASAAFPDSTFFVELPYGGFYGFPCLDGRTIKLAEHTGGEVVPDPLALDRDLRWDDSAGPDRFIGEFAKSGADMISVHQEAVPHLHRTLGYIRECGVSPGVALNPSTPLTTLQEILPEVDYILLMSVNPGFGGQRFIPSTLRKARILKSMIEASAPGVRIEVDGGVGPDNIADLQEHGAQIFVAGSAVFGGPDPADRARDLVARLGQGSRQT